MTPRVFLAACSQFIYRMMVQMIPNELEDQTKVNPFAYP